MFPLIRFFIAAALMGALCQCTTPISRKEEAAAPIPVAAAARWDRVATRLAANVRTDSGDRPVAWKFSVRQTPGLNARSWPDGRIEVTSGILTFVKTDAELAAVAAHEMAHVYCRHGRERAMESWTVLLGGAALGAVLAHQDGDSGKAIGLAAGAVLTVSSTALAARQRDQEFEADRVSLDLLRRAGYPAPASAAFWERYAAHRASHGLGHGGWWKSHPPDAVRLRRLREMAAGR